MALGLPSPPAAPAGPLVPTPPNILLFQFTVPRPGVYSIRCAVGDALVAVTNQQIQVYDNTILLATLFTGASAPADSYIDAQANVLTAANWATLNASRPFIFQTTSVVIAIGDGVNHTFVSALQVTDAVAFSTIIQPLRHRTRQFHRLAVLAPAVRKLYRRRLYSPALVPFSALVKLPPQRKLRVRTRPQLKVRRPRKLYPVPAFVRPIIVQEPRWRRRWWQAHKPLHIKRRQLLPRIIPPPPPLFVPYHPIPRRLIQIHRKRHFVVRQKYPLLRFIQIVPVSPNPTAKIIVLVT